MMIAKTTTATDRVLETLTDEQIEALQREAGQAGDEAQVAICERALDRSRYSTAVRETARRECARVIAAAQAMVD
jgi:hypothetical protein